MGNRKRQDIVWILESSNSSHEEGGDHRKVLAIVEAESPNSQERGWQRDFSDGGEFQKQGYDREQEGDGDRWVAEDTMPQYRRR